MANVVAALREAPGADSNALHDFKVGFDIAPLTEVSSLGASCVSIALSSRVGIFFPSSTYETRSKLTRFSR